MSEWITNRNPRIDEPGIRKEQWAGPDGKMVSELSYKCLVTRGEYGRSVSFCNFVFNHRKPDGFWDTMSHIIAWMPSPEPYTGDKEQCGK